MRIKLLILSVTKDESSPRMLFSRNRGCINLRSRYQFRVTLTLCLTCQIKAAVVSATVKHERARLHAEQPKKVADLTCITAKQATADAAHLGLFPFYLCQEGGGGGVRPARRRYEKLVSLLKGCVRARHIKLALQQSYHSPISKISQTSSSVCNHECSRAPRFSADPLHSL